MRTLPYTEESFRLLHEGSIALAQVTANGIRIDEGYLTEQITKGERTVKEKQLLLNQSDVMKAWRDRYRGKTNFNSTQQLGKVLFEVMGFKSPGMTEGGQHKTDEDSLSQVDSPFIQDYLAIKRVQKGGQFLQGITRELVDGLIHPFFNLNIATTYRSSSDSPNFQNLPVRNEELKQMVRRCVCARKGRRLIEIDYKGVEVACAACYHRDPTMIRYLKEKYDYHREAAMLLYMLPSEEMDAEGKIRYFGKNQFVFPQFYGSWWFDCAANLWAAARKLKTRSGVPLRKWLKRKGIKRLGDQDRDNPNPQPGTFEHHVQAVEREFWAKLPVYAKWKKDWYRQYRDTGYFVTKTGFICQGYMARNDVINYGVQGSAFHWLLWGLTEMVRHELKARGMRTLIIAQIHDSMLADVPDEEVDEFLALCHEVMVVRLRERFPWIVVPVDIEIKASPVGGSWVDQKEVKLK